MNSTSLKTILVTGANKGIGYGIINGLIKKGRNFNYILTSRNEELGKNSLSELTHEFSDFKNSLFYHQLDITKEESVNSCLKWVKSNFGGLDILVNNAGVAQKGSKYDTDVFDFTFETNLLSTVRFTEIVIAEDLIKQKGKIVIVGSSAGQLGRIKNDKIKEEFRNATNYNKLFEISKKFREAIANNKVEEEGWPTNIYSFSKMAINTYARILGGYDQILKKDIGVYVCCPGWVRTDMTGPNALLSIEEGIKTPIYLIEKEDGIDKDLQGKFFEKCQLSTFDK